MIVSKSFDDVQHKFCPNVFTNWISHDTNEKKRKKIRIVLCVCNIKCRINWNGGNVVCVQRKLNEFWLDTSLSGKCKHKHVSLFYCFIFFCSLFAITESYSCAAVFFFIRSLVHLIVRRVFFCVIVSSQIPTNACEKHWTFCT